MRVRYKITLLILLGLIGGFLVIVPVLAQNTYTPQGTCPAFVDEALTQVGSNCANLGGSSACYGYGNVEATTSGNSQVQFSQPADRVGLSDINGIQTFGYSQDTNAIGIALLNVNANAISTNGVAADDVRYILFGDVELSNAVSADNTFLLPQLAPSVTLSAQGILRLGPGVNAPQAAALPIGSVVTVDGVTTDNAWAHVTTTDYIGWMNTSAFGTDLSLDGLPKVKLGSQYPMQSFNFSTGDEALTDCTGVPAAVLILQAPPNTTVDVTANGVDIRFSNTVLLRTNPDNSVQIMNLSGDVTLNPGEANQTAFRAAGAVAARLGAAGTTVDYRLMSESELVGYGALTNLPSNVLYSALSLPSVVQPSSIGPMTPIVVPTNTPPFNPPSNPPETPFPLPPLGPGSGGVDLDAPPWEAVAVGGAICPTYLIYHSDRTTTWDLYRTDSATGTDVNLSNNPTLDDVSLQPTHSPDGEYIAYTTNRDDGNWEIYLTDKNGSFERRITFNTGVDLNPVWGPNDVIVFESNRDANWELYSFNVATGVIERLTDFPDGADVDAFWKPDGTEIVFSRVVDGNYQLFTMDMTSAERPRPVTQLTTDATSHIQAKYSYDGTKLLYLARNQAAGVFDLHVLDLTTNEDTDLVSLGADVNLPAWSPDDSLIAFESNTDGDFDVFAVQVAENGPVAVGTVKNVSNNTFQDRAPTFYCESNQVVYQSDSADINRNFDIFMVNPDLSHPETFLAPTRITSDETNEIYAENSPADEEGSREGRLP